MNSADAHFNLMKDSERLSSSPVRLRIMLPVLALFACIGMALWWAILFTQLMMTKAQAQTIDDDVKAKSTAHAEAISRQNLVREMRQQLDQLMFYKNGVRAVGGALTKLADVMPLKVQLTELSFAPPPPEPPPPPGQKLPTFGPTTNVETQKLIVVGRTTKETPVVALMESLDADEFAPLVTKQKRVKSFRQDSSSGKGNRRLLTFEIEYIMPGRSFSK